MTHELDLWVIAHPTEGVLYGFGDSAHDAWINAMLVCHGEAVAPEHAKIEWKKKGWRAKRCTVTL